MSFFFKDLKEGVCVSWNVLINDINSLSSYNPYCKTESYYEVFKHIIASMILGKEIILLDSDFSESELKNFTGYNEYEQFTEPIYKENIIRLSSKEQLIENLKNIHDAWKVTLFTSGTTGVPKKVSHSFSSITRYVKMSERNMNSVWGFAYNPTHMAGLQVFFQALLNGNSIVKLFELSKQDIYNEIKTNKITNISATPTFYRLLLPCDKVFTSVTRITSGGEKFNENTIYKLKEVFPNAKITNVYASTEAGSLFASKNDVFTIKSEDEAFVRVVNGELLIHKSLLGESELEVEKWYNTGDLIEVLSDNPLEFRFLSRKSDMINVGGYKVNPLEVEEAIHSLSGVRNVRVFSKTNSVLGNIICCEVVADNDKLNELAIREFLQSKIQEFKIPRIIRFVDKLSTTRTGKIKRT